MNPTHSATAQYIPRLIAWEITRTCNLNCRHCRAAAGKGPYKGELTTSECESVLSNIASFAKPIIILTGGEPMLRDDIYHIARFGTDLGLHMVMAPCGALLNDESCKKLIDSGIKRISLSIDGATAQTHDSFRRVDGAFDSVMKGIEVAKKNGMPFQINTTVSKLNVHELPAIFDMVQKLGAASFHPFLLVPTGRGKDLVDYEIPAEEYERVLNWIYENRSDTMSLKPTCAPHYYRILRQREHEVGISVTVQTHGADAVAKGCLGGHGFAFISYNGSIQMCGFLDISAGDLRTQNLNFKTIWDDSPFFTSIRNLKSYKGSCGVCEYQRVCGGCRARAFAMTGDYLAEEPFCMYTPNTEPHKEQ